MPVILGRLGSAPARPTDTARRRPSAKASWRQDWDIVGPSDYAIRAFTTSPAQTCRRDRPRGCPGPGALASPGHGASRFLQPDSAVTTAIGGAIRGQRDAVLCHYAPRGGGGPGAGVAPGPVVPVVRSAAMLTSLRRGTLAAGLG